VPTNVIQYQIMHQYSTNIYSSNYRKIKSVTWLIDSRVLTSSEQHVSYINKRNKWSNNNSCNNPV